MSEREPRKIALVGTSCTGKTTIVNHYKNTEIFVTEEAARVFFILHAEITDRFSAEAQGQVQDLALHNEQRAHASGARGILTDRSVIDAVVYVRATGDREGSDKLLKRAEFWIPTYHKFLLLDHSDIGYQKDDIRQEEPETREQFHKAFIEFFEETGISYELLSGTLEERIARIDQIFEE